MHLARPLALLLIVPLAWLLLRWHFRRRPALRFPSLDAVRDLPPGRAAWVRRGSLVLRAASLFLLVLALSGPRWPDPGSRVPTEGISIALVVDASASMAKADFLHDHQLLTRWQAVQKTARLFIEGGEEQGITFPGRPNDLFALVTFAQRPETDCPLTLDHDAILALLEEETPRRLQGTNPGDAIAWGLHLLSKAPTRRKALIFLSDGEDNVKADNLRPRQAAQLAAAMGVPIYAVEIEPLPDESLPEEGKGPRANMQMLAKVSSGMFFAANDGAGLAKAYAAIDEMERDRITTYQFRRYDDMDSWFAAAALGVLLLLLVMESTRWRVGP